MLNINHTLINSYLGPRIYNNHCVPFIANNQCLPTLLFNSHCYKPSTYECINEISVGILGSIVVTDGALFHHIEPVCSGVLCPPYDETKELYSLWAVYQITIDVITTYVWL